MTYVFAGFVSVCVEKLQNDVIVVIFTHFINFYSPKDKK